MNYYNEHDTKAAAWLRELINAGLIPNGDVDERSITEVQPDELRGYTQCHFFAGIGGWSVALQLAGWPADRPVWTGSCPCQPFSSAGKGLGDKDERHLWPVFFNLIKECKPNAVFGEQVASAIGKGWLDGVSSDLESEGYACGATVLGAHSVSAPHIRQRLYWVADSGHEFGWRRAESIESTWASVANNCHMGKSSVEGLERPNNNEKSSEWVQPIATKSSAIDGLADSDSGRCEQRDEGIGSVSVVSQSSTDNGLPDSGGWQRIIFSADCDEDGNCPKCEIDYADCECLGPTQDGVEYKEFDGITFGRLANSISERGCSRESRDEDAGDARITGEADRPSGMVNSIEQGLQGQHRPAEMELHGGEGSKRSTGPTGFWDQYDICPCRDGKSRRIECQSRGLADGLSTLVDSVRDAGATEEQIEAAINPFPLVKKQLGRTILLKGYGNAIVPQVAAEFVKAYSLTAI